MFIFTLELEPKEFRKKGNNREERKTKRNLEKLVIAQDIGIIVVRV